MLPLVEKMLARADHDALPSDHPLRELALNLEQAASGFFAEPQTVKVAQFVGCWARARRAWCEYSGEPLII